MLEALIERVARVERAPLVAAIARRLAAAGEALSPEVVEDHLEALVAAEHPAHTFLAGARHRLLALVVAVEDVMAHDDSRDVLIGSFEPSSHRTVAETPRAFARTRARRGSLLGLPPASFVEPPAAPSAAAETMQDRVRRIPGVSIGLSCLDRRLLDGGGDRTYAWDEDGQLFAIGPRIGAIVDACQPAPVCVPPWLLAWRTLTAAGQNPWRLPDVELRERMVGSALARTQAYARRTYGGRGWLRARFEEALVDWAKAERRRLGAQLGAPSLGEVRALRDGPARQLLLDLWRRPAELGEAARASLRLAELSWGPLGEVAPVADGLELDVVALGRAGGKLLHVRALRLAGAPGRLRAIALAGVPRGASTVEGGDVLVTMFEA